MSYRHPWWAIDIPDELQTSLMSYRHTWWATDIPDELQTSLMSYRHPWWATHIKSCNIVILSIQYTVYIKPVLPDDMNVVLICCTDHPDTAVCALRQLIEFPVCDTPTLRSAARKPLTTPHSGPKFCMRQYGYIGKVPAVCWCYRYQLVQYFYFFCNCIGRLCSSHTRNPGFYSII